MTESARIVWVQITWDYWAPVWRWPQRATIYLRDILRDFVQKDDEIMIDLKPLKDALSHGIVIKTHPLFYVLQDSCMSDTYDQQLMKNFKGVYGFITFLHNRFDL